MGTTSSMAKSTSEAEAKLEPELKEEETAKSHAADFEMFRFRRVPNEPDTTDKQTEDEVKRRPSKDEGRTSRTSSTSSLKKEPIWSASRTSSKSSLKKTSDKSTEKISQKSSTLSLRKSCAVTATDEKLKKSSTEDSIIPETKDEVDAPLYNPKMKEKYFGSDENEESVPEVKDVIPIPAKSDDDLKAAKLLIEKFPDLKQTFELFDTMAVEISEMVDSGEVDETIHHLIRPVEMSYFDCSKQEEKEALSDYLVRINMTQLLCDLYELLMKEVGIEYVTESILNENIGAPATVAIFCIRGLLWNYTDASMLFAEYLAETGFFKFYIRDLKAMQNDISEPKKILYIFESAMGAIHNCSKSPATRQIFRSLDAVTCIIPFLKCDSPKVKMIVLLTLAYIISEDQNHLLMAEKKVYGFLLRYIKQAWKSTDHRYDGFAVDELVAGMKGLAKNDENKKLLMEIGTLPVLVEILKNGKDGEKRPAIECIWELLFDKENQTIILKDKEVMALLKSVSKSQNKNIAKAASGALWVLGSEEREKKLEDSIKKNSIPEKKPTGHIMISYAWTEQKKVIQVKEALKRANFHVWMDVDNMGGSTLQAMAEAVENAAVVLICMSDRYKQSQNCRNEAEYAFSLKKDIVPLLMEKGYKPDGWLGMIKGTKLFFEFSGKYQFETKIEHLIKELGSRGKTLQAELPTHEESQIAVIKSASLQAGKGATVAQWSGKDVQNWLQKNKLTSNTSLKKLTGEQLEFLQKLSLRAPEFYFGYLERKLELCSLEELMKFSHAVDRL